MKQIGSRFSPAYMKLFHTGELNERIAALRSLLEECTLCPHRCGVNRIEGETGICRAGEDLKVSSAFPHFGEEAPLVGKQGSGTIFLAHCNLRCVFCQNDDISHGEKGEIINIRELANLMLFLQQRGCHNINFVTPTHFAPQLISALPIAIRMGLLVPIVYNCGGYESIEVVKLLDGIVDIYMPDAKFSSKEAAEKYCNAPDYFSNLKLILKEMHRQVGDFQVDSSGIARQGLLIRHLVMPNDVAGTEEILSFISSEISTESYVNLMDQYRPCYRASEFPELNRRIKPSEFKAAIDLAKKFGLKRGIQA
ncbi:radical SAM protein [candidate division KSB1 bacterium]|nr:radical SAM protein [candidate division KSB1 bacterium]